MNYDKKRIAGLLFFVGAVQFVLAIVISEAIYSGYSVGQQGVSALGDWSKAGNYAAIWNVSIILFGMFTIVGAYFIQRGIKNRLFSSLLVMSGIGSVGVGVIAENISYPVHSVFALVYFVFWAAAAIVSYKFLKSPFSYVSIILGAVQFLAIVLFVSGSGQTGSDFYLGVGLGGMERLIIYPSLLWLLGFGAYLIGNSSDTATTSKA